MSHRNLTMSIAPLCILFMLLGPLLTSCDTTEAVNPVGRASSSSSSNYIAIRVNQFQILKSADWGDVSEVRLLVVAGAEDPTYSAALVWPANHNIRMRPGDTVQVGYGLEVDTAAYEDAIYVYFTALDADRQQGLVNLGARGATGLIAEGIAFAFKAGATAASFVTGYVLDSVSEYVQEDDILGSGLFILKSSDGWGVGQPTAATSEDGNLRMMYQVVDIGWSEASANVVPDVLRGCEEAAPTRLAVGAKAKVVWYDVNYRSTPEVPAEWRANVLGALYRGDIVRILDGPVCAHGGYWWLIMTPNGQRGWMREALTDRTLMVPLQ